MTDEYITTTISIAVHQKTDNPIFGETVTTVSIDDEAAGAFIVISQNADRNAKAGEIKVSFEELQQINNVTKILINQPSVK